MEKGSKSLPMEMYIQVNTTMGDLKAKEPTFGTNLDQFTKVNSKTVFVMVKGYGNKKETHTQDNFPTTKRMVSVILSGQVEMNIRAYSSKMSSMEKDV